MINLRNLLSVHKLHPNCRFLAMCVFFFLGFLRTESCLLGQRITSGRWVSQREGGRGGRREMSAV